MPFLESGKLNIATEMMEVIEVVYERGANPSRY